MPRRVYLAELRPGRNPLPPETLHHLRDVLRLTEGSEVEAFDAGGQRAVATLRLSPDPAALEIETVRPPAPSPVLAVGSAVPKGDRADVLVEKLAELGVSRWIPLATERSVVIPKGDNKRARWQRIAQEAARQCSSPAVMTIDEVVTLPKALDAAFSTGTPVWFGSTEGGQTAASLAVRPGLVMIGPEGDWSPAETREMLARGCHPVTLGRTILRVETAAIVAAALALALD